MNNRIEEFMNTRVVSRRNVLKAGFALGASTAASLVLPESKGLWTPAKEAQAKPLGDEIILLGEDGDEFELSIPDGFTPTERLKFNTEISPKSISGTDISDKFREFQSGLNEEVDGFPKLAGYSYGYNDVSFDDETDRLRITEPAYAWTVYTGLEVDHPAIGHLIGGDHKAVMLLVLNRDKTARRNTVAINSGFWGTGRIWDGENNIDELERRLVAHYSGSLLLGEVTSGFTGQCDDGDTNCSKILAVTADRVQWGNNENGSKRFFYRLIRAETITEQGSLEK